jgi:hypothetical protein
LQQTHKPHSAVQQTHKPYSALQQTRNLIQPSPLTQKLHSALQQAKKPLDVVNCLQTHLPVMLPACKHAQVGYFCHFTVMEKFAPLLLIVCRVLVDFSH